MHVPAAVRKCSIVLLQEVANMNPAFGSACVFAVALLGVRTRRCIINDPIFDDHLGSQTMGAPLFCSIQLRFTNIVCDCDQLRSQSLSHFPSN
jgi:hypothetical protein